MLFRRVTPTELFHCSKCPGSCHKDKDASQRKKKHLYIMHKKACSLKILTDNRFYRAASSIYAGGFTCIATHI